MATVVSRRSRVVYLDDLERPAIIVKVPYTAEQMIGEEIVMFAFETSDGVLLGTQTVIVSDDEP